jgi:hypothetical protein
VEEGKQYACGILGRKGYEGKRKEIEEMPSRNPKYII